MSETPTERNRRIFDEATARGEPVFVVRAKDLYAGAAVQAYKKLTAITTTDRFAAALDALIDEMQAWQIDHPAELKIPDVR